LDAGVTKLFLPNVDHDSIAGMDALAGAHPDRCFAMMGLHPCSVGAADAAAMEEVERLLRTGAIAPWARSASTSIGTRPGCAAAGGLPPTGALGQGAWLPIAIHCRNSFAEVIAIVEEENDRFAARRVPLLHRHRRTGSGA
jgi:TatD DNase family protein